MPIDPEIKKAYEAKIAKLIRDARNLNDETVKAITLAAAEMRKNIHSRLQDIAAQGRPPGVPGRLTPAEVEFMRTQAGNYVEQFRKQATEILNGVIPQAHTLGTEQTNALSEILLSGMPVQGITPDLAAIAIGYSADLIQDISQETLRKINSELSRAILGEQTPYDAMKSVDQAMGVGMDHGVTAKAERIVRTEVTRAYNGAQDSALKQLADKVAPGEVLIMKTWVSAKQPGRTRDGHWEADGQTVPYDQAFMVRPGPGKPYEPLMYPGDPAGSAANVINCLCRVELAKGTLDDVIAQREKELAGG